MNNTTHRGLKNVYVYFRLMFPLCMCSTYPHSTAEMSLFSFVFSERQAANVARSFHFSPRAKQNNSHHSNMLKRHGFT